MSSNEPIRFNDGAAYERFMGVWSQKVGQAFLQWLAPAQGLRWLDVGCGNGAFTAMVARDCGPKLIAGVDPSEPQLAYARQRQELAGAQWMQGDAMALPYPDNGFDVAVMPLVIFFVPDPAKGVAEMVRVVSHDGTVCAYAWDMEGGGFPYAPLQSTIRKMGFTVPMPPSPEASNLEVLAQLWQQAGLTAVETTSFTVERRFASFDEYWEIIQGGPSVKAQLAAMSPSEINTLQATMRELLKPDQATGHIVCTARANAIKGKVVKPWR